MLFMRMRIWSIFESMGSACEVKDEAVDLGVTRSRLRSRLDGWKEMRHQSLFWKLLAMDIDHL